MKISVVMATCNGERYLKAQIESILFQTLPPDEFWVCDDCSDDGTKEILEDYQQRGKLKFVRNAERLGLIGNFKKAVALASCGHAVALADQDDIWLPEKLEKSLAALKSMEKDYPALVHTDLRLTDEKGMTLNSSFRNELGQDHFEHNLQSLLFGNFVTGCTMLMNPVLAAAFRDIPETVLFHDNWIALVAFCFGQVSELKEALIHYRKHTQNLSIASGTRPRNRYRSLLEQLSIALRGRDNFLAAQFSIADQFYAFYKDVLPAPAKLQIEQFLQLADKPYLVKKIAFRRMVRRLALPSSCGQSGTAHTASRNQP